VNVFVVQDTENTFDAGSVIVNVPIPVTGQIALMVLVPVPVTLGYEKLFAV